MPLNFMYTKAILFPIILCVVFLSCSGTDSFRQEVVEENTSTPSDEDETNPSLIVNGDMEDDISMDLSVVAVPKAWTYLGGWNEKAAIVEQKENSGVNNSRCLAITALDEETDVMFAQKVAGLKPGGYYKATAKVKTDMIVGGMGANLCLDYLWAPTSGTLIGSHSKWQDVALEIDDVSENGEVTLCLRLGNTAASSKGLVYFDNVVLKENKDLYIRTSRYFRLVVSKDLIPISDQLIDEWLANMDEVYDCYKELFKGKVPFDGKTISIRSKEIDAWAYAGNPIQWNKNYIYESLQTIRKGDWCFGIMHEIGHNFAPYISNATYAWNWNEELFANFRMFYALEKLNATIITTASVVQADGSFKSQEKTYIGSELLQLYKSETDNCYDRTIGAGKAVEMGNALCYCLIRIKETYGWELYQNVFEELYSIPRDEEQEKTMNQWQKFEYFLSVLAKHAKVDTNELFSKQELQIIESYLSTQQ